MSERSWIVGIDLRQRSDGALRLARWFRRQLAASGHELELHGVHVIEREKLSYVRVREDVEAIGHMAQRRMDEAIEVADARKDFASLELAYDLDAEDALAERVQRGEAEALVVGRRAKAGDDPVIALGRVARRVLRMLPCPVIVTPPDLEVESLGRGPIAVATSCRDEDLPALAFARTLAEPLGRELVLVHVVPMPADWGDYYLPTTSMAEVTDQLQAEGEAKLAAWAKDHGIEGVAGSVLQGNVVSRLSEFASERGCPLVVTGSRGLGGLARLFVTSVGSELAASAPCSVAVVPGHRSHDDD